ncbi:MAG: PAS domain S-box protein [Planctomycetes bacterium]|nr:PAS domain S-box protein [Planctomycetota bacterium]
MFPENPIPKAAAHGAIPGARIVGFIFLAAAVLLVASTIFVYQVGLIRIHAQGEMASHLLVLQQLDEFLSFVKDTETGQRGYLLTGDEPYLQPYTNGRAQVQTKLDGIQRLALSSKLPKDKVERVAALTRQKLAEMEQSIQLRRDKGLDAALAIVRKNQGRQVMDEIRAEIGQMRAEEEKEFAAAGSRADWANDLRTATFIIACLVNLVFLGLAFRKISGEVRQREAAILENSRQKELLATTLASIGDGVIATDAQGRVTFLNAEAEKLTGWKNSEAPEQPLPSIFRIINERTRQPAENPVDKVLRLGTVVGLANHTLLLRKDGTEIPIDDSAAPIRLPGGPLLGVVLVFRDFTEQRKAMETRARLAAIVEFSGDAIFTKNLDGAIQTWNASAERLFGYRAEEIIGKPVTVLIPPDHLAEEEHILERLRQGQPPERLETIRVAKDGSPIPVLVTVSPIKDAEDNVIGASKVIRDITDLVTAREALVSEKELLSTTLASIGDGVIATDAQVRVAFLNGEAERLTGWKSSDAAGRPLAEIFRIIHEQTRQPAENPVEKVLRLGTVVGLANHTLLIAKDGREIPIDDSAAPIRRPGGRLFGVVLVFRDFTEQKQTAAKLQELALLPAQNPAPILRIARDGKVLHANPAALNLLQEGNLAIGQTAPAHLFALAAYALNTGKAVKRELTIGKCTYLMAVVPVPEVDYVNLYGIDVTERKHAEEALRDAHGQLGSRAVHLEKLVQQRTERQNEMVGDLEAFSYSIVHDMRGPLRAMQSFAQLLATECGPISSMAESYVRRIKTASERMDRLIQDGFNYSRLMRAELPLAPTDAGALLRGIVETYPAFQPPHAEIELEYDFPLVQANEAALTQGISNLLGNAVKFVAPGVTPRVRAWAEKHDGRVRLFFKDNGIGIEKEAHEKIFQIFQRLDNKYEGTGVGLAIAKKAAERMGGSIGVESAPGSGGTFWLELPSANEEMKQAGPMPGDLSL